MTIALRISKRIRSCIYYPSPIKTQVTDPEVEIKFGESVLANAQIQTNFTPRAADFGREPYFSRKFSVAWVISQHHGKKKGGDAHVKNAA